MGNVCLQEKYEPTTRDAWLIFSFMFSALLMLVSYVLVIYLYYVSYLGWTPLEMKMKGISPWFNSLLVASFIMLFLALVKKRNFAIPEAVSEPVDEVQHFYSKIVFFLCLFLGLLFFLGAVSANTDLGGVCYQGCLGVLG